MTATELRDVIISEEYRKDVQELSCYLASIKQERPLIYALAKQLWKRGIEFQLEAKRTDLVVNEKKFEFKFTYDCDMGIWKHELETVGKGSLRQAYSVKLPHGWVGLPRLYSDVFAKQADVFVWIILSRDLSKVERAAQHRICLSDLQRKWNKDHAYSDHTYIKIAQQVLDKVRAERSFTLIKEEIRTTGMFPSTYHFWLVDFLKTAQDAPRSKPR